jgi:hypothetical protein
MHEHRNLTFWVAIATIATALIAGVAFVTGVPSLPALYKIFRPDRPSSSLPWVQQGARQSSTKDVPADPITFVAFLTGALDKKLSDISAGRICKFA